MQDTEHERAKGQLVGSMQAGTFRCLLRHWVNIALVGSLFKMSCLCEREVVVKEVVYVFTDYFPSVVSSFCVASACSLILCAFLIVRRYSYINMNEQEFHFVVVV